MKTRKIFLIGLSLASLFVSGCYYDNAEYLYPSGPCNAAGSTYAITVNPIIVANCNACHSASAGASSGGGVVLDTYNSLKPYATNGKLLGTINHASGFSAMPKNAAKLSSCDIAKITNWVNSGALNN
jgi:uncharacterized membrane protein